MLSPKPCLVEKTATQIVGFDQVANGGLPTGRTTLVAGTSGSAKTVFAAQFLAESIRQVQDHGVFVTFEESPSDIRLNMHSFGWDIEQWEAEGRWAFVDASPQVGDEVIVAGSYDFSALLARIEYAVQRTNAQRVALDSIGTIFMRYPDHGMIRHEILRIVAGLKQMGVTSVMTVERTEEYGAISRYGVEEFVADNVIILRNALEDETRRRTLEVLKFRGTSHQKGEFPFTVSAESGLTVIPLSSISLMQSAPSHRVSSGNETLDQMCDGGFFRGSVALISGATGTGKTLATTEFMAGGPVVGERSLFFTFEESADQLKRNAKTWGIDFDELESRGALQIVCEYPESASIEEHLVRIKAAITTYQPDRVAVDSLSALSRATTRKGFREFVIGLTSFLKKHEITGLFTSVTPALFGNPSVTDSHFSTITDTIIVMRYVELFGHISRSLTILKMRGSWHDKDIREFSIDDQGMHIGERFQNVSGILTGALQYSAPVSAPLVNGAVHGDENGALTSIH